MCGVDDIGGRSEEQAASFDIVCGEENDFFIGLKLEFRRELRIELQIFHFNRRGGDLCLCEAKLIFLTRVLRV